MTPTAPHRALRPRSNPGTSAANTPADLPAPRRCPGFPPPVPLPADVRDVATLRDVPDSAAEGAVVRVAETGNALFEFRGGCWRRVQGASGE